MSTFSGLPKSLDHKHVNKDFRVILPISKMESLTNSQDCVFSAAEDTYLTWNEMNVTTFGSMMEIEVDIEDVCKDRDPLFRVVFSASKFD